MTIKAGAAVFVQGLGGLVAEDSGLARVDGEMADTFTPVSRRRTSVPTLVNPSPHTANRLPDGPVAGQYHGDRCCCVDGVGLDAGPHAACNIHARLHGDGIALWMPCREVKTLLAA